MEPITSLATVVRIDLAGRSFLFVPCKAGECVGPVPPRAVSFVPSAGRSPSSQCVVACARGACTLSRGRRLYRPRGTTCQPLFQCVGPAPHCACLVSTDPAGCSFGIATRCRLYARGLSPLPWASSVCSYLTARQVPPLSEWEGAVPPSAMPYVPTPPDARSGLSDGAACAREACNPSRGRRLYLPLPRVLSAYVSRDSLPD